MYRCLVAVVNSEAIIGLGRYLHPGVVLMGKHSIAQCRVWDEKYLSQPVWVQALSPLFPPSVTVGGLHYGLALFSCL